MRLDANTILTINPALLPFVRYLFPVVRYPFFVSYPYYTVFFGYWQGVGAISAGVPFSCLVVR